MKHAGLNIFDKRTLTLISGFILFIFGGLAIVLSLVGVKLIFLTWIDVFGDLASFVVKLVMLTTGISLMYVSRMTDE